MDCETLPSKGTLKTIQPNATTTALAPGFRFHPTDEELVSYYLKRKVTNKAFHFNAIAEVDIYKNEPWDLVAYSRLKTKDQVWYFFNVLDKKFKSGARMNRTTGTGYWKSTGKDHEIRHNTQLVGMKKTLVFHNRHVSDKQRTNWVMHEYRLVDEENDKIQVGQDTYTLCRVFHKTNRSALYAPFNEEEWDDGNATFPGEDAQDDLVTSDDAYVEMNGVETVNDDQKFSSSNVTQHSECMNKDPPLQTSEPKNKEILNINELPTDAQAPLPLLQYKRRRQNDSGYIQSYVPGNSSGTGQDPSSAEKTMSTSATTTVSLEFPLSEPILTKESVRLFGVTLAHHCDSSVSPRYVKLIDDLKKQMDKVTAERETLNLEVKSAQAIINVLQSRIDSLSKANEDFKKAGNS
uniref:NAC transcription factor 43 n=1 Tax=Litchi chinensis TaxID=151069 RepID=A0A8K1HZD2_LITCN|nr:NAC transcription factor 43 [Litchi chinensis]